HQCLHLSCDTRLYSADDLYSFSFFFHDPPTTEIYTLSLHDALPIYPSRPRPVSDTSTSKSPTWSARSASIATTWASTCSSIWGRSEEHTSELQSRAYLVCRLLLEKKKKSQFTSLLNSHTLLNQLPTR